MYVCLCYTLVILVPYTFIFSHACFLTSYYHGAGAGEQEQWNDQHVADLPKQFGLMLKIMEEELEKRFLKPDDHTMLSMCMNPSFDTSEHGALFKGKPSLCEIMMGFYTSR